MISCLSALGQTYTIFTYAGSSSGFSGDGGPVAFAQFYNPSSVDIDRVGNVFIADAMNTRIRKVDAISGNISTICGDSTGQYFGDGGLAVNAGIGNVRGLCVDQYSNVYFCDYSYSTIRKIDASTGIITKIAGDPSSWGYNGDGGVAINALLYRPTAVFVDTSSGQLYFSDTYNHRIRVISLQTGVINTVAGNGISGFSGDGGPATSARLNYPVSVTKDLSGNIYFGDYGNHVIRRISVNGVISTIAGTGTPGYAGDGGPAVSAYLFSPCGLTLVGDSLLYFTDLATNRVRMINLNSGIINLVAGNGVYGYGGDGGPAQLASLANPNDLAITSSGDILVADVWNSRIRKIAIQVGFPELMNDFQVDVFPNPCSTLAHISSPVNIESVRLFSIVGQEVISTELNQSFFSLDVSAFTSGTYLWVIQTSSGTSRGLLVKE
ncbi:MAG: T9SS type A sorting domain-containing protein [Bacteroidia bacterium]|nr:T9SS type A sorting domain-containing protein [Bacteroidia bacterium]